MKIWVDADACPGPIKELIIKAATGRRVDAVFVANKVIVLPTSPYLSSIQVPQGPDVADHVIATESMVGDMVITQDIPLAAELVPRGIVVMNPHGSLFTEDSIRERLSVRDFMHELRGAGMVTGGPKPFGPKEKQQFANTFDRELTRLLS